MDHQRSIRSIQDQDKEIERERLTTEELESIPQKKFTTQRLTIARDVFAFCCLPALTFIDVKILNEA